MHIHEKARIGLCVNHRVFGYLRPKLMVPNSNRSVVFVQLRVKKSVAGRIKYAATACVFDHIAKVHTGRKVAHPYRIIF